MNPANELVSCMLYMHFFSVRMLLLFIWRLFTLSAAHVHQTDKLPLSILYPGEGVCEILQHPPRDGLHIAKRPRATGDPRQRP